MPNKFHSEFDKFPGKAQPKKDTRGSGPSSFGMPMKTGAFPGLPGPESNAPFPTMGETGKFNYAQKKGVK